MSAERLPLFKYFGSKCRSSKYYPAPIYDLICEPTCGHPSYSRRYGAGKQVILIDVDPELVALLRWLIQADPQEILALPHESLVVGQDLRTLGLRPEAADLLRRWQRTGTCSSWTVSTFNHIVSVGADGKPKYLDGPVPNGTVGKNTGMWHPRTREYLAKAVQEIRHWQVFQGSWEQIIPEEAPECTWFIDPPYQNVKGGYKYGREGIDYQKLAAWCKRLRGQVIVCEQEGADWLPFRPCCEVSGMRGKMRGVAGAKSREVIWTND